MHTVEFGKWWRWWCEPKSTSSAMICKSAGCLQYSTAIPACSAHNELHQFDRVMTRILFRLVYWLKSVSILCTSSLGAPCERWLGTNLLHFLSHSEMSRYPGGLFHRIYWENVKSSNCWEYAWYSSRYRREGNAVLSPLTNFFSKFRDKFREKWWKKSKHGIYRKSEAWWAKPGHPYGQYVSDLQSHHVFTFSPWISSEASLLWETIASSTQSNRHRLCARLYHFAVHPKPIRNQIRRKFGKLGQIWNSRQPVILSVRHSPKQNGWYSNKYEYWIKLAH